MRQVSEEYLRDRFDMHLDAVSEPVYLAGNNYRASFALKMVDNRKYERELVRWAEEEGYRYE